jgi:hypothetical protein
MSTQLKKVTVYLTAEEYADFQAIAVEEEVSVGAVVRARLGLNYRRRGAPAGNRNRQVKTNAKRKQERGLVSNGGNHRRRSKL